MQLNAVPRACRLESQKLTCLAPDAYQVRLNDLSSSSNLGGRLRVVEQYQRLTRSISTAAHAAIQKEILIA